MASSFQLLASVLLLVVLPTTLSLPVRRTISRPRSVSAYSPLLRSKAFTNAHVAQALYGAGAYNYHPIPSIGFGTGLAHNNVYGGFATTPYYNGYNAIPNQVSSNYESYQGLGHSVTSKQSSYVSNNYGYPTLGSSYDHSANIQGGLGAVYPGVYVPIGGAKYRKYGNYDHFGFGSHGTYEVTPGYTRISHSQTIPHHGRVNKLRGYGK